MDFNRKSIMPYDVLRHSRWSCINSTLNDTWYIFGFCFIHETGEKSPSVDTSNGRSIIWKQAQLGWCPLTSFYAVFILVNIRANKMSLHIQYVKRASIYVAILDLLFSCLYHWHFQFQFHGPLLMCKYIHTEGQELK